MAKKRRAPSVFDEPHMRGGELKADPSEERAETVLWRERGRRGR